MKRLKNKVHRDLDNLLGPFHLQNAKFMNTYNMAGSGDAGMDKFLFSKSKGLPVLQEPMVADVSM